VKAPSGLDVARNCSLSCVQSESCVQYRSWACSLRWIPGLSLLASSTSSGRGSSF